MPEGAIFKTINIITHFGCHIKFMLLKMFCNQKIHCIYFSSILCVFQAFCSSRFYCQPYVTVPGQKDSTQIQLF